MKLIIEREVAKYIKGMLNKEDFDFDNWVSKITREELEELALTLIEEKEEKEVFNRELNELSVLKSAERFIRDGHNQILTKRINIMIRSFCKMRGIKLDGLNEIDFSPRNESYALDFLSEILSSVSEGDLNFLCLLFRSYQ